MAHTLQVHVDSMVHDFNASGIPWKGMQCRNLWAGGTGVLYALPALVCPTWPERAMWCVQAFLSVWADYFHIHHDSIAHGLDRWYARTHATFSTAQCSS